MTSTNINAFFIGLATAYYALMAYQLFFGEKRGSSRLHRLLGWIFVYWSLSNAKDLVLTFPGMYNESTLRIVLVCDGWSALTYMAFLYELTRPGWFTAKHLAMASAPFFVYTAIFVASPTEKVVTGIIAFLVGFGLYITVIGYKHSVAYMYYIRQHYSNIDEIDISWLRKVFLLAATSLLTWLFTSLTANTLADCLYYVMSVALWQMVIFHCRRLKQVKIENTENKEEESAEECERNACEEKRYSFAGLLEEVIEGEKLYLYQSLTLDDLAKRLKTNRTYLSSYFSNVVNKTFYDYINELRIKEKSIPMLREHPEYTFEYIAQNSGFNSISTFRRAFRKITKLTPSEFREKLQDEIRP